VLSANGQWVAFTSLASDLVANDDNVTEDVFVRDLSADRTTLVSVSLSGRGAAAACTAPSMSADGRYVAFESSANNLVAGGAWGGNSQIFLHDLQRTSTVLVTTTAIPQWSGTRFSGALLSPDGRFVSFTGSGFSGPTRRFVKDLQSGTMPLILTNGGGAAFSADGRRFATILPGAPMRLMVYDLIAGTRASLALYTLDAPATRISSQTVSLSGDGRFVAFSWANSLLGIEPPSLAHAYLFDTATSNLTWVIPPGDPAVPNTSLDPQIDNDGGFVVFRSIPYGIPAGAPGGIPGVGVFDRRSGKTTLVAASPGGPVNSLIYPATLALGQEAGLVVFSGSEGALPGENLSAAINLFAAPLDAVAPISDPPPTQLSARVLGGGTVQLTWSSTPSWAYRVQYKRRLDDPLWEALAGTVSIAAGTASFTDTDLSPGTERFYRLVLSN